MKKTFPLTDPARDVQRVVEAVKHEVRKYVKRERRKTPPEGFDLWEFGCRVGPDQATATALPLKRVTEAIDAVAQTGATAVYVEILASPAKWPGRPAAELKPAEGEAASGP